MTETIDEPIQRLLATHPLCEILAISIGGLIRILNLKSGSFHELRPQKGPLVRALCFSSSGGHLIVADDEKKVEILDTTEWKRTGLLFFPKKLSAAHFIPESNRAIAADRFGDLYCFAIDQGEISPVSIAGHFCSIVTSLIVSCDGRLLCTSDRDGQTRITVLPEVPDRSCCEIQCFCMGHSQFISSSALALWNQQTILATGGGDGLVLFFDPRTGDLLAKFDVQSIADELGFDEAPIILSIAATHDKPYLALIIENQKTVVLLRWDGKEVEVSSMMSLRMNCMPSFLTIDLQNCLWIIGGPEDSEKTDVYLTAIQIQDDGSCVSCEVETASFLQSLNPESPLLKNSTKRSTICKTLGKRKYSEQELEAKHKQLAYVQHAEYIVSVKNKSNSKNKD